MSSIFIMHIAYSQSMYGGHWTEMNKQNPS